MSTVGDIEWQVRKLDLRPEDVVVLSCEQHLSEREAAEIRERLKALLRPWGLKNRALILSGGLTLDVLSRADIEKLPP